MAGFCFLLEEVHADVHRDRIETAAVHDAGARFLRAFVVRVDHLANPLRFASQVAIVGGMFHARGHEVRAVQRIRPDGREHDARARGEFAQRVGVRAVGYDDRQVLCRWSQFAAHAAKLLFAATGDRPAQPFVQAVLPEQVFRDELSRESCRAVDDNIKFPIVHKRFSINATSLLPPSVSCVAIRTNPWRS